MSRDKTNLENNYLKYKTKREKCFKMATKFSYACEPVMFHANGRKVGDREMPPASVLMGSQMKKVTNCLLKKILVEANPVGHHKCNSLCHQQVQFLIGFPHGCDLKSAIPVDMREMVENFEEFISERLYGNTIDVEIQSVAIRLLPCSRYLEIIETAFYL